MARYSKDVIDALISIDSTKQAAEHILLKKYKIAQLNKCRKRFDLENLKNIRSDSYPVEVLDQILREDIHFFDEIKDLIPDRYTTKMINQARNIRGLEPIVGKSVRNKYNENYFEVPNLENSYWAGFIAADGCVREKSNGSKVLNIKLSQIDQNHLSKLAKCLNVQKIYNGNDYLNKKVFPYANLQAQNEKIFKDLDSNFNIRPNKTFNYTYPNLEGDLALAFIAGYIDGDGSYYSRKYKNKKRPVLVNLGTEIFLNWCLEQLGFPGRAIHLKNGCFTIKLSGNSAIMARDKYIGMEIPFLERKYKKWEKENVDLNIQ